MHSNFAEETSLRLQIKELADVQSRNREQLKLNRSLSSRERMEARLEAIKQKVQDDEWGAGFSVDEDDE